MKKYDVVIVGFGPTGGTLANLLALHGFSILVLEKEKSFYPLPRAVHFDDEVMRVFETIGITNTFLKHTIINKGTKFVDKKNRVILDWPRPREITENGWYPSYRFNQPDLERELRKKLKSYKKVEIKQSSNVKKIMNNKNNVDITVEDFYSKKIFKIPNIYYQFIYILKLFYRLIDKLINQKILRKNLFWKVAYNFENSKDLNKSKKIKNHVKKIN